MKIEVKNINGMTFEERSFASMTNENPQIISIERDGNFKHLWLVHFLAPTRVPVLILVKANNRNDAEVQIKDFRDVEPDSIEKHHQYFGKCATNMIQRLFQKIPHQIIAKIDTPNETNPEKEAEAVKNWLMSQRKKDK